MEMESAFAVIEVNSMVRSSDGNRAKRKKKWIAENVIQEHTSWRMLKEDFEKKQNKKHLLDELHENVDNF